MKSGVNSRMVAMNPDALKARAAQVLRANDTGAFIKPSRQQYPHQWNWDAALIALGLGHLDMARARNEVRTLLSGQWRDGMLPHILYPAGASDYFPTPDFWQLEGSPDAPALATSGLTQPPVLASAVRLLHLRAEDQEVSGDFVREVYPKLLAWHRWLHQARDPEATGLVALIHPWESGTDNATRWTEALARITPSELPAYRRKDQRHVHPDERPRAGDYDRFIYLIDRFRRWRWQPERLYRESPFLVQDVLFNAILYRADADLRALAQALGEPTEELDAWLAATKAAFDARFWDEAAGLYFDVDLRAGAPIRENSCATFAPLYAGLASEAQARRLVEEHLRHPDEYAPDAGTRYFLPSVAKSSPHFEPRRYWCGPVWININWLVYRGLRRYGYPELARTLRAHSLELMAQGGFAEYYDPRDGAPLGAKGFSWSAALALDFLGEEV